MKMIDDDNTEMELNGEQTRVIKKVDGYGANDLNFSGVGEIMVTITLKEYRNLVSTAATTNDIVSKARNDKYNAEKENEKLKKENAELKAELYSLNKKVNDAKNDRAAKKRNDAPCGHHPRRDQQNVCYERSVRV